MKPALVIGNKNYSSWSLRAWLMVKHLNIDFEEIQIPLQAADVDARIRQYSPAGKVPVYLAGVSGLAIWDSMAICEYLAEHKSSSDLSLWPKNPEKRAFARSISAEIHSGFNALRQELPMNCRATDRQVTVTPAAAADIQRIIDIWEHCLSKAKHGPWLFGNFSIADAMYAPVVSRFHTYGIECPKASKQYMDTVLSSPHMQMWYAAAAQETAVIEEEEVGI